jgi:hypothetical protein
MSGSGLGWPDTRERLASRSRPTQRVFPSRGERQINGKVTNAEGQPVSGALVEVASTDLGIERQATTASKGEFLFALLPTGA